MAPISVITDYLRGIIVISTLGMPENGKEARNLGPAYWNLQSAGLFLDTLAADSFDSIIFCRCFLIITFFLPFQFRYEADNSRLTQAQRE